MSAPVSIGDLRHRVRIEDSQRVPDGAGGASLTWSPVAEVFAAIWPRTGSEQMSLDRVAGKASHDIWIRYRPGVRPQMRIVSGARVFDILGVLDIGERRRWLKCIVEERDL